MKKTYHPILSIIFFTLFMASNSHARNGSPWVGNDFQGKKCFDNRQTYGPYSYTNATHRRKNLPIVEKHHFTPEMQLFKKGHTGYWVSDIAYTLRAFPNHYKALTALTYFQVIFQIDINKKRRKGIYPAIECYFQKAFKFVPKDATVHMLYAIYLKKIKRYTLADQQYREAIKIDPDDLRFHYLYGEFLLKQKKFALAQDQAEIVYEGNYPKQKLKQKLIALGYWE